MSIAQYDKSECTKSTSKHQTYHTSYPPLNNAFMNPVHYQMINPQTQHFLYFGRVEPVHFLQRTATYFLRPYCGLNNYQNCQYESTRNTRSFKTVQKSFSSGALVLCRTDRCKFCSQKNIPDNDYFRDHNQEINWFDVCTSVTDIELDCLPDYFGEKWSIYEFVHYNNIFGESTTRNHLTMKTP
eukprot:UN29382